MGRTNVAYCAKGPVGHGRTLLLHITHGGKLRISSSSGRVVLLLPVEEANCMIQDHRYVKSRKEKMSLKENGRHVFLFGQSGSWTFGKRAMLGLAALAIFLRFRYLKVPYLPRSPPGHFGHFHYERPKLKFI